MEIISTSWKMAFLGMVFFSLISFETSGQAVIARNMGNYTLADRGVACVEGTCDEGCGFWVQETYGWAAGNSSAVTNSDLTSTSQTDFGSVVVYDNNLGTFTFERMVEELGNEPDMGCNPYQLGPFDQNNDQTVQVIDWRWTGSSLPGGCVGTLGSINLNSYFVGESGATTYSGSGVSGTTLNRGALGVGTHTITATRTFSNGGKSTNVSITIDGPTTLAFSSLPTFCISEGNPDLHAYTNPDGGTFSGSGLVFSGSVLNLSASGVENGTVITYTYTNGNGCISTIDQPVTINAQNTVNAGSNQESCRNEGNLALTSVTSGVTWSCVGCSYVSGNNFDTNSAPAGDYTVRASKTVGACSDTDDKTITILELPTVGAGSNLTVCVDDPSFNLNGESPTGGVWSSNCGSCLSGSLFSPANAGSGTHTATYTYTNAQGCVNSDSRTITVVGLPNASSISTNSPDRCGSGTLAFTASLSSHTIRWYTASSGGTHFRTSNTYSPSLGVGVHTYYVAAVNSNDCESPTRKAISGEVFAIPPNPSADDEQRCGTGVLTFNASGSGSGAVYRWYENASGGSAVHTGASFLTPVLSSSRDYYVSATSSDGCLSPSRTQVTATIDSYPGAPTVFDNDRCGNGVVVVSVGGAPAGGSYRWYTAASGGSSFNSSNSHSPNLTTTTTYHVSIMTAQGCEGVRAPVTATVFSAPAAPAGTGDTRCGSGTVSLSASASNVDHYNWFATSSSSTSLSASATYSPSVGSSGDYWVSYVDNNGCLSPRTQVLYTVNPIPSAPTAGNNERCGSGSVEISASGSGAGATYTWYANSTGGSALNTGATYDTPNIGTTTTYYVSATSSAGCVSATRTPVVATINAFPSAPTTFDSFSCGAGIVTLTVIGTPAGGSYRWYSNETGGASFNSTNSFDANLAITEDYWVSAVSASGCESGRSRVIASIHAIPSAPAGNDGERCGTGTVDLSVSSGVSGTFDWYATEFSNTSLFTGANFTTPSISETTSYWVEITDNNTCVSNRTEVVATVNEIPANPTAPSVPNCGAGIVALSASGSGDGAIYNWFDNASGGGSLHLGASYNPSVTTTRDFYVQATSAEGCVSVGRTQVTVTVNAIPGTPTVFDGENCGAGVVSLTVGGTPAGGDYRWYNSSSGGTSFNSTNAYDAVIGGTTSYWVSAVSAQGCEGDRAEIIATINSVPNSPVGTGDDRCGPGVLTLTATAGISGTFNWYDTEVSAVSQFIGASFTTPGITETTSYWVDITDVNGCVSPRTEVVATVFDIPDEPIVPDVERCGTGAVTIDASGSVAGAVYEWFDSSVGGSPIFTGASYTTALSLSRSYFVSAISPDGCPSDNRTQVDVTINPLPTEPLVFDGDNCGAGIVGLTVAGAPAGGSYNWYPTDTGGSSFNSVATYDANVSETTSYWVSIVTPDLCEGPRAEIIATINEIPLAPVGNGNEICGTGSVSLSASSAVIGAFNWYSSEASNVSLFTGVNYNTPVIPSTTSYWVDITDENGCTSARTEVVATVNPLPAAPTADPEQRCGSGDVTMDASGGVAGTTYRWYLSSTGGTQQFDGSSYTVNVPSSRSFFVSAVSPESCESASRTEVVVTIDQIPSLPVVFNGENCGAGDVELTVGGAPAGGSYRWYADEVTTTSFNSSNTFTASVTETTSYYVSIISAEGCEGDRAEVVATINDSLAPPSGTGGEICGSGQVNISAFSGTSGTYNWYSSNVSVSSLFSGSSFTTPSISLTTSYWVDLTDANGCVSPRTEVIATVHPLPNSPTAQNEDRCGAGDVTMNASGGIAGTTYRWYLSSTGGSHVFEGDTYITNVSSTRSYYVSAISPEFCESAVRTEVVVTINPPPGEPLVFDGENCGVGTVTLSVAGAPAGGSYQWYQVPSGGTSFNSSNSFEAVVSETTSYYVSIISAQGCEGDRAEVVATINEIPPAPIAIPDDICGSGSVGLSANSGVAGTFNWYATQASVTSLFTGVNYSTPVISETTSYWVDITDSNGCVSPRTEVVATVNPLPPAPDADPEQRCGSGDVTMNASGSVAGATYNWYSSSSGGSVLATGSEYTTSVTVSRNYYVSAVSPEGCESGTRTQIAVTIDAIPGEPIVFNGTTCGEGDVSLSVGGAPAGGEYRWYQLASGGSSFNNTNSYTANHSETTSYYVSIISPQGCEGARAEIVATVYEVPSAPIGNDGTTCGSGTVALSASAPISGTFSWYATQVSTSSLFAGVNFQTPVLNTTTTYWVEITNSNGCTSPRTMVTATVYDIPVNPVADNVSICGAGEVNLTASGSVAGATYRWFENSAGGSPIHVGEAFSPFVSLTRNYFVEAVSPEGCISSNRTQVRVTVDVFPGTPIAFDGENCGAGTIALNVAGASAGGEYRWYLDQTSTTSFNNSNSWDAAVTETTTYYVSILSPQGCEGPREPIVARVNSLPSAPSGSGGERCGTGSVSLSASSGVSGTFNWYATQASVTSLFTGVNYNTPAISSTTSYWVDFTDANGCVSPRTEVVASVLSVIPDPTVPNVDRCGTGVVSITASVPSQGATFEWYENQFGGTPIFTGATFQPTLSLSDIYYVKAISDAGCESLNRTPVTVTINPIPSEPIVTEGNICGIGAVSLQAAGAPVGGSYNWYISDVSTSVIATGSSFTTPELSVTTGYYVSIVNQFGCEGARGLVNAVVNDFPDTPQVSDVERCGSGDIELEATTSASSVNWYFNASGGSPFASGLNVTIDDLDETTVYYASSLSAEGCESSRVSVTATIDPIVASDIGGNIELCLNSGVYDLTQDLVDVSPSDGFFVGEGVVGTNLHPSIAGSGNKEVSFVLTSVVGCLDNGSRIITILDVKENGEELELSTEEINACILDGSIDLNDLPNVPGGTWIFDAEDAINVGIIDPLAAGVGEFTATYSVGINGCIVTTTLAVNITSSPEDPIISGETLSCVGDVIELTASGGEAGTVYHWYKDQETTSFETNAVIEVQPEVTTTYRVEAENAFGCLSSETETTIEVVDLQLDFTATPNEINVGERTAFTTEVEATEYLWDFGDELTSTQQNPQHIYFEEGVFDVSLTVITEEGCNVTLTKEQFVVVNAAETVTGIEDELVVDGANVYPSPFNDRFTLAIESRVRQEATVYLYSIHGTKLLEKVVQLSVGENSVDFQNLSIPDGIYMLRLIDENNVPHDKRIFKRAH